MINNREVPSVVFPYPNRTDVKNMENWIYNLNVDTEVGPIPFDILENVNVEGDTDEEYDQIEKGSPVHEQPLHHSPYILISPA